MGNQKVGLGLNRANYVCQWNLLSLELSSLRRSFPHLAGLLGCGILRPSSYRHIYNSWGNFSECQRECALPKLHLVTRGQWPNYSFSEERPGCFLAICGKCLAFLGLSSTRLDILQGSCPLPSSHSMENVCNRFGRHPSLTKCGWLR